MDGTPSNDVGAFLLLKAQRPPFCPSFGLTDRFESFSSGPGCSACVCGCGGLSVAENAAL